MLKLKYLIDNRPLVKKILSRWSYDEDSLDLLDQYRISSNAVYPFLYQEQLRLLRFYPIPEKPEGSGQAEISFLKYLQEARYPSLRIVPSIHSNDFELFEEDGTLFFACVFARVPGVSVDSLSLSEEVVSAAGKALGELHSLASLYAPDLRRWSYTDVLSFCRQVFDEVGNQEQALREADFIEKLLDVLPKTSERYGLIHFDFERDNLFYCQDNNTCHVIDFDDAMYHFYAADVERALSDLTSDESSDPNDIEAWFLSGYRSVRAMSEDEIAMFPLFQRFANLYGYARVLRVIEEPAIATPEWMTSLLARLEDLLHERSVDFGKPLFGMAMRGSSADDQVPADEAHEEPTFHLFCDGYLIFPVPDPLKTAAFYEDKLSFTAIHSMNGEDPHVTLIRDDVKIILYPSKSTRVYPHRELYGTPYDAYIVTTEPDLLQTELMVAEVSVVRPIGVRDHGNREFVIADIDGRWIGIGLKMEC